MRLSICCLSILLGGRYAFKISFSPWSPSSPLWPRLSFSSHSPRPRTFVKPRRHPHVICYNRFAVKDKLGRIKMVRCGYCLSCKRKRVNELYVRCHCEFLMSKFSYMVTLTYDDENLPRSLSGKPTLRHRDLQLALKRYRKNTGKFVRYMAVGEYGGKTNRPHYHVMWFGDELIKSELIAAWSNGFVDVRPYLLNRARYIAKYVLKSVNGEIEQLRYGDRIPPYMYASKKLGYDYVLAHGDRIAQQKSIRLGKFFLPLPRLYSDLLGVDYSEDLAVREADLTERLLALGYGSPADGLENDLHWWREQFANQNQIVKSRGDLRGDNL